MLVNVDKIVLCKFDKRADRGSVCQKKKKQRELYSSIPSILLVISDTEYRAEGMFFSSKKKMQ